ncbi:LacI family DNA-binding transcriptional regulator [Amnibacterium flavum]|uniref:Transcriptional regulator n=1 Tax=Amnibacterium flavum TaxID=2173173 RepID=A0A2V1HUC0_9MICO|nr:LacI family DNA-binding transcriptional regulator [Amnibacterium flavum]PVZ94639.1 transcriptional regulator [Amnibacterium flavum]
MTDRVEPAPEPSGARRAAGVGMRDVARAAGVSTQTVSRVLNGHPHIRDETRERVLEVMGVLGYRVNNAARALGTQQTKTIGVIAADATLYGPSVGIAAVEAAARAEGRWIATTYADADDEESVLAALDHLRGQGVDGIVLIAAHSRTRDVIDRRSDDLPVSVLHGDLGALAQREAAAAVVDHLVGLGHRRLARVGGPSDWLEEEARSAGFEAALINGVSCVLHLHGDWSAASGAVAGIELAAAVRAPGGPTAIVVANDQMALGVIASLRQEGIEVPRDVSVAGFDDAPDAAFYLPSLTTVRLDVAAEARRCVLQIVEGDVVRESQPPAVNGGPPVLVERASTARPSR